MNNCNCCCEIVKLKNERMGSLQVLLIISHSAFQTKMTEASSVEYIDTFKKPGLP